MLSAFKAFFPLFNRVLAANLEVLNLTLYADPELVSEALRLGTSNAAFTPDGIVLVLGTTKRGLEDNVLLTKRGCDPLASAL